MQGLLIALAALILFGLLGTSRFSLLRKMAIEAFSGLREKAEIRHKRIESLIGNTDHDHDYYLEKPFHQLNEALRALSNKRLLIHEWVRAENHLNQSLKLYIKAIETLAGQVEGNSRLNELLQLAQQLQSLLPYDSEIEVIRANYNEKVSIYNQAVYLFPSNVFALVFRYGQMTPLDSPSDISAESKQSRSER